MGGCVVLFWRLEVRGRCRQALAPRNFWGGSFLASSSFGGPRQSLALAASLQALCSQWLSSLCVWVFLGHLSGCVCV